MRERERLIELLKTAFNYCEDDNCKDCIVRNNCECIERADYLLENGVIVPPCRVGSKVFVIYDNYVTEARILAYYVDGLGVMCDLSVITQEETATGFKSVICKDFTVDDIFLTKEEAEKALKAREKE